MPKKELYIKKVQISNVRRAKVIAIAFTSNGRVITYATNKVYKGHGDKFTLHAEEYLIKKLNRIKAKERFGLPYILVLRWSKDKGWANAKPCYRCERLLKFYGYGKIYYSNDNGEIVQYQENRTYNKKSAS